MVPARGCHGGRRREASDPASHPALVSVCERDGRRGEVSDPALVRASLVMPLWVSPSIYLYETFHILVKTYYVIVT